jgi:hypothetical protein
MEQTPKTFAPEETGAARWMGRVIVAVILGEAIWNLTVSVTNYVVVPWLGDLFGRSSNLPASFTQRPYNYPDLFVSMMEFGLAGLLAAVLNYLFERRRTPKVKLVKRPSLQTSSTQISSPQASPRSASVEVAKVGPQPVEVGAKAQISPVVVSPAVVSPVAISPIASPLPEQREPVIRPSAIAEVAEARAPLVVPPPAVNPPTVASAPPVASPPPAKPLPPASTAKASKPKKPKAVYYNIVGEPMPSDED